MIRSQRDANHQTAKRQDGSPKAEQSSRFAAGLTIRLARSIKRSNRLSKLTDVCRVTAADGLGEVTGRVPQEVFVAGSMAIDQFLRRRPRLAQGE